MEESIVKVFSGQGNKNKEFACENLRTKKIVNQLKQIYLALLENDKLTGQTFIIVKSN